MPTIKTLKLTEAKFTKMVIDLAKLHHWRVAHFRPARTNKGWRTAMSGDVGFPDLVLAKAGRVVFAELKVGKNWPTAEQAVWLEALEGSQNLSCIWYPEDWDDIVRILSMSKP